MSSKIITMKNNIPVVDEGKCNFCGKCTNFCPNNAREYVGKDLTSQEIIKEIIKDEVFYEQSSGGVTFSGGEPMLHADFINGILEECKVRGIHTTIDTSGYVSWTNLRK